MTSFSSFIYRMCVRVFCAAFLASSLAAIQDLLPGLTSKQCNREAASPSPLSDTTYTDSHTHAHVHMANYPQPITTNYIPPVCV